MMEGKKMESHQKGYFLKLKCFSLLRILTSHLFEETLGAFLFLPLLIIFSLFYAPSLDDLGVFMIFEEKMTSSKIFFSNGMA
jgi:hypothetical protein